MSRFSLGRYKVADETELIKHHAEEEIEHLHKVIGEQYGELEDLRDEIKGLKAELGILE